MYYPYFRGKQFELLTIRESASLIANAGFVPIIEPVRDLKSLKRALDALCEERARAIVIINPYHGDHSANSNALNGLLRAECIKNKLITIGILIGPGTSITEAIALCNAHKDFSLTIVHSGFTEPRQLADYLKKDYDKNVFHIFIEEQEKILYRKHFEGTKRVLVIDGFKRKRNADYPPVEEFSDLHLTYRDRNMSGYGDFLVVGDNYAESGGPAYAVAIHMTFIDPEKDDVMYVYHFLSDTNDTPTDPAGKFEQALRKLINIADSEQSKMFESSALREFRELHRKGHFPGLGYVKKLSMKHHLETLANYHTR